MKIESYDDEKVRFSNGCTMYYDHEQECCEMNYADFSILDVFYNGEEFNDFHIEGDEKGFVLVLIGIGEGNGTKRIYVPCYSDQNGYYTSDLDIIVKREEPGMVMCRYYHLESLPGKGRE